MSEICQKCGGGYREKVSTNHSWDTEGHLEHCGECGRDWWVSSQLRVSPKERGDKDG